MTQRWGILVQSLRKGDKILTVALEIRKRCLYQNFGCVSARRTTFGTARAFGRGDFLRFLVLRVPYLRKAAKMARSSHGLRHRARCRAAAQRLKHLSLEDYGSAAIDSGKLAWDGGTPAWDSGTLAVGEQQTGVGQRHSGVGRRDNRWSG
jgi:hypothetical protein